MLNRILRGQLVDFISRAGNIRHQEKGAVVIGEDGCIKWRGAFLDLPEQFKNYAIDDYNDLLLLPGFVDAHIHFPQYRMLAAPASDLLEWLSRYTFPEEARYYDDVYAAAAAEIFLERMLAHGTTSALVFCSVHRQCVDALFSAASKRNMALISGKTMMDRNATPAVQDTPEQGGLESETLYHKWHGKNRLRYAVTPRFAVTSTDAQLAVAGELTRSLPGVLMQTHISESLSEIELVKQLFPWSKDYTDVYDRYGLLSERSLFAHGIHLTDRERERLRESESTVVHCPTSNAFLGSGIMPMRKMRHLRLGVATDIGGGTSYSLLATLGETYKLQMLSGYKPSVRELYFLATLGNAQRLQIDGNTGSLDTGKFADVVVLDPGATAVLQSRQDLSQGIEDILFSLMMLGDDRAVKATYVAGTLQFKN